MLILLIIKLLIKLGWINVPNGLLLRIASIKRISLAKPKFAKLLIIVFASLSLSFKANAEDRLPVPKGINNQLFYLQRDPDANTLIYQLNLANGKLNDAEPVSVFWIRYTEGGKIKPLTSIERRLAYGIKCKKIDDEKHELHFVAYPKLKLILMKSKSSSYHIYTEVENQNLILNRIYVKMNQNGIGWPNVVYIELNGTVSEYGKSLKHRIYI